MTEVEEFLITEIKNITFEQVELEDSLIEGGVLDSITIVDLLVSIEEKFGIHIPVNDISPDNFDTVKMMINKIESKKSE